MENSKIKWGGYWRSPADSVQCGGELLIDEKHGVIMLTVFHIIKNSNLPIQELFPDNIPVLYGEISNGTKITLTDCKVVSRHNDNFVREIVTIYAQAMFVGEHSVDELEFDKVEYELSNILQWTGLCKYIAKTDSKMQIEWENTDSINIKVENGVNIEFSAYIGPFPYCCVDQELSLTQGVKVNFRYASPKTLKEALIDVRSLIQLIDLAVEDNIYIQKITCYRNDKIDSFNRPIAIQTYIAQPQDSQFYPHPYYYLFDLHTISQGENLIPNWFQKYPILKPVVDLYSSVFTYPQMPVEMIFLNIVQALETYHSRFVCDKLEEFKEEVHIIVNKAPEEERNYHKAHFLNATQMDPNIKYIILKSRLCQLFICNFEFQFSNLYDEPYPYSLIDSIVATRHYFTHYSPKKEAQSLKGEQLEYSIRIMRQVLEFYLLKEIGFSPEYIENVINKRKSSLKGVIFRTSMREGNSQGKQNSL